MKVQVNDRFKIKFSTLNDSSKRSIFALVNIAESLDEGHIDQLLSMSKRIDNNVYSYVLNNGDVRVLYIVQKDIVLFIDLFRHQNAPLIVVNKNPSINGQINPNINGQINPNINGQINPSINGQINPNINGQINPNINGQINPNINGQINPNINGQINPDINGQINPNINGQINPNININFGGFYFFDLNLRPLEYIIRANVEVLLFFDFMSYNSKFAVRHPRNGYVVFTRNTNNWIAHMESDGQAGFNMFDLNNCWIGFIK